MNIVVIALYRITNSLDMTYALALKLYSNKRLTRVFHDESAQSLYDMCNKLKVFIQAYLPRLGQAMHRADVETDYFA